MSGQIPTFLSEEVANLSQSPTPAAVGSLANDGGHLQGFRAPDLDAGDDLADAPIEIGADGAPVDAAPPAQLDKDAFYTVFKTGFDAPQMFMGPDFAPVAIQPQEADMARAASDGLHTILKAYYPQALSPLGDTAAAALALGMFAFAKIRLVQAIMAARKAQALAERQGGRWGAESGADGGTAPANENTAPPVANRGPSPIDWMDAEAA